MARAIPLRKMKQNASVEADSFSRDVRHMVEQGLVALTNSYILKSKMVQLIQKHSAELEILGEDVSEFFLDACDMMVTGELSRMQPDAFKVYLVVMAYSNMPAKNLLEDKGALAELTGVTDHAILGNALEHLSNKGFIDSANNIVSYANKRSRRKSESPRGGLLDRFAF